MARMLRERYAWGGESCATLGTLLPVRKVSNWGGNIIGSFPSLKMKISVKYESTIERDFLYFLEYDADVKEYYAQPMTIEQLDAQGKTHTYTPDFLVIRANKKEIVECKPEALLDRANTRRQMEVGEAWATANNHDFILVTDVGLRRDNTLANLKLFWRYSRLVVPTVMIANSITYLKMRAEDSSFEDLAHHLASMADILEMQQPFRQVPFIYSMLFRHILKTDLSKPITSKTILQLSPSLSSEVE